MAEQMWRSATDPVAPMGNMWAPAGNMGEQLPQTGSLGNIGSAPMQPQMQSGMHSGYPAAPQHSGYPTAPQPSGPFYMGGPGGPGPADMFSSMTRYVMVWSIHRRAGMRK